MQNLASFIEYTNGNKPYTHTFMRMQLDNGTIEEVMARLKFLLAYFGDGVTVEQVERALQ